MLYEVITSGSTSPDKAPAFSVNASMDDGLPAQYLFHASSSASITSRNRPDTAKSVSPSSAPAAAGIDSSRR